MQATEQHLIETLKRMTGLKARAMEPLAYQASNRRYFRARLADGGTRILMVLPSEPTKAEEITDGRLRITELPFLTVQRRLREAGVPVPEVHGYDQAAGVVVLEDLGDVTLEDHLGRPECEDFEVFYREAVRIISQIQRSADVIAGGCVVEQRRFDERVLMLEFDHFREYGVEARTGRALGPLERKRFDEAARDVVARLTALPQTVVHRDFQSRNLMLHDGHMKVIDFQDALIGPYVYDLVALLRDSYIVLETSFVDRMLTHYRTLMPEAPRELGIHFDLMTVQRKLKDAGRFVFIDKVKGNPSFMRFFAPSLGYGQGALARLREYPDLLALVDRVAETCR
jgi:aminoglycoside/choline kinase family phosphotransferase